MVAEAGERYASEELPSEHDYHSGYRAPRPLEEQRASLIRALPSLSRESYATERPAVPGEAEGLFVIPRWELLAPTYNKALEVVLGALEESVNGAFKNWRAGKLSTDYLRAREEDTRLVATIEMTQRGNGLLLVPAQFGRRHRGRSVRRAREYFSAGEFGLGAYHVGIMLLTHPDRLTQYADIWVDCGGDEYAPEDTDDHILTPYFYCHSGTLFFGVLWSGNAFARYGSATGWVTV